MKKQTLNTNTLRSTTKEVRKKIWQHIVDHIDMGENQQDALDTLAENVEAVKDHENMTDYQAGRKMVENGIFLVYDEDIVEFLESLNLKNLDNNINRCGILEYYSHLIGREVAYLLNDYNRYNYITIDGYIYHINDYFGDYNSGPVTVRQLLEEYENRDVTDTDLYDYAEFIDFLDNIFKIKGGR